MSEKESHSDFDSTNLVLFLWSWKKPIIILTLIGIITSIVVSFLIQEQYKSTVVLFPAQTSSMSKALLDRNASVKHDILAFGEEEQIEQLLQILYSDNIRNQIVEKYQLMKHYDIDEEGPYKNTFLMKEYESHITFEKTKFGSIEIEVMDHSPDTAALIANDIAELVDAEKDRMLKERANMGKVIVEKKYQDLKNLITSLNDSLQVLREYGVHDYESQSEMFNAEYAQAISKGNFRAQKMLEEKLDILAKYGGSYVSLTYQLEYETERLSLLGSKLEEINADVEGDVDHKFILNSAFPADRKAYPVRWLIVAVSTIATFLFAVIMIIIIDSLRKVKK